MTSLLPPDLAALYADVQPATLRVWRHRYGLTTVQLDGVTHYRMDELADLMRRRSVKPTTRTGDDGP